MKRVVWLDLKSLHSLSHGLGQFSYHLMRQLLRTAEADELTYMALMPRKSTFLPLQSKYFQKISRYSWCAFKQWAACSSVWHMLHQDLRFRPALGARVILTIHDINYLNTRSLSKAKKKTRRLQLLVDRAQVVTTISNNSKQDIEKHLDVRKPVHVIYNGVSLSKPYNDLSLQLKRPFLLIMARICPDKNQSSLIDVMPYLDKYDLIIAGKPSVEYLSKLKIQAKNLKVDNRIWFIHDVSQSMKSWLLKTCSALLFPSKAEGFGLPVIEAMRHGKPVFLSNLPVLHEVAGNLAFYFRSFNPQIMAEDILFGLQQYKLADGIEEAIIQHSMQYQWDKAALQYIDLYKSLL